MAFMDEQTNSHHHTGNETFSVRSFTGDFLAVSPAIVLLLLVMCAAFAATGAGTVMLYGIRREFPEGTGYMVRVALKTVIFGGMALWGLWAFLRHYEYAPDNIPASPLAPPETWKTRLIFLMALLVAAGFVLPNLTEYPWLAPDEAHHLIVARNLADYNLYASGHPDTGFVEFDSYDSVGAPVIMPVALAFRALGSSLLVARLVMASYFLMLFLVVYLFARPLFGDGPAICSALMMLMTGSSIYLGRSLYGEVPALFFLLLGLTLWRHALHSERNDWWGLCAGVCFAMAVLCKTIFLLTAFAFAAAWLYDFCTYRQIQWRHVGVSAFGFVAVLAAWWCYQAMSRHSTATGMQDTMGWYQTFLLFGLKGVPQAIGKLLKEPMALLAVLAGLCVVVPWVFRQHYDPPAVVLFLVTCLYLFWWTFFTPGKEPRYFWISYAPASLFIGALIWLPLRGLVARSSSRGMRLACIILLGLFAGPALSWGTQQAHCVRTWKRMKDDYALAALVQGLPQEIQIATTYYPVGLSMSFLTPRYVPWINNPSQSLGAYGIVIVDKVTQSKWTQDRTPFQQVGRYWIFLTKE